MTGVLAVAVTAKRFVMELSSRVAKAKRITEVDVPMICLLTISRHGHNSSIQGMKPASRTTFVRQKPCVLSSAAMASRLLALSGERQAVLRSGEQWPCQLLCRRFTAFGCASHFSKCWPCNGSNGIKPWPSFQS